MTTATAPKFKEGQRVVYIPGHANGDHLHPDCDRGVVMGQSELGTYIYVMFSGDLHTKSCSPESLKIEI